MSLDLELDGNLFLERAVNLAPSRAGIAAQHGRVEQEQDDGNNNCGNPDLLAHVS